MNKHQLNAAIKFHGHLGPWLVMGLRAGLYVRRRFLCSPFELTATVICPAYPPVRCVIDGIQLGSGCTMGKGNISHKVNENHCLILFRCHGRHLELTARPEIFQSLREIPANRIRFEVDRISRLPFHSLFLVKPKTKTAVKISRKT